MGKNVRSYKVSNLSKVDTTKYTESDLFITDRSIGILLNGSIKTLPLSIPNMRNYVKKDDVKKMIQDELEKSEKNE